MDINPLKLIIQFRRKREHYAEAFRYIQIKDLKQIFQRNNDPICRASRGLLGNSHIFHFQFRQQALILPDLRFRNRIPDFLHIAWKIGKT